MRILHVVEATGGGVRRHLQLVLPGLRARGHEVALAYSLRRADPGFSQDLAQFEAAGIVLREIPMRRLPAPVLRRGVLLALSRARLVRQDQIIFFEKSILKHGIIRKYYEMSISFFTDYDRPE